MFCRSFTTYHFIHVSGGFKSIKLKLMNSDSLLSLVAIFGTEISRFLGNWSRDCDSRCSNWRWLAIKSGYNTIWQGWVWVIIKFGTFNYLYSIDIDFESASLHWRQGNSGHLICTHPTFSIAIDCLYFIKFQSISFASQLNCVPKELS